MSAKSALLGLIAIFWMAVTPAMAAQGQPHHNTRGPQFKDNPTQLNATANQAFSLQLATLLSDQGSGPLSWGATGLPKWLSISGGTLFGTAANSDAGTAHFLLSVADSETGSANHDVYITVLAPPQWTVTNPLDLGIQNDTKAWSFDLKTIFKDPAGGPTTCAATGLPGWMKIDTTNCVLSGTPQVSDDGNYSGITLTATGKGGTSASLSAFGQVIHTPVPPKWVATDITLPDATEDASYAQILTQYVLNPDNFTITYDIASATPPPWAQIGASSGTLFGTPNKNDLKQQSISVSLATTVNGQAYTQTATFHFNVIHVNHPPTWLADPINLPADTATQAYTQNISSYASDPDVGDTLTYAIVSFSGPGTNWATLDPKTGVISGTPTNANAGTNTWKVSVTDQTGASATTDVVMTVNKINLPPHWNANPIGLSDAHEDNNYAVDLTSYVTDPNHDAADPISFTKLSGPAWITITPSGILTGTPGASDVGMVSFQARVSNKEGGDTTTITFVVVHTNHPPVVLNPIVLNAKEDQPLSVSLAPYAHDPDAGDKLTFAITQGKPWATLSADGTLTGTPKAGDVGDDTFSVTVTDQAGASTPTQVIVHVEHVNHPPSWTQNPITLPDAKEASPYSQSVASFATDPDAGDKLTFSLVSGPAWVTVSPDGTLSGTPARADTGTASLVVRVTDPSGLFADATVTFPVDKVNHPPRWRQNPINMADAYEDTTYSFNLAPYAVDDDGDPLTFAKVSGPDWLFVNNDGTIAGVPAKKDVGNYTAVFSVTDGKSAPVLVNASGTVIHKNHPPVIDATMPEFTVKERDVLKVSLLKYVTDADGDKLTFTLEDTSASWLTLSSTGDVTASPQHPDLGEHSFAFSVTDGQVATHGILKINVIRDPRAPVWLQDPMKMDAKTGIPVTGSLASNAKDLDGYPITFKKTSGPDWLKVDAQGNLSGAPANADLGDETFVVTVCNDVLCADAKLIITVKPGMQTDITQIDSAVPGARAENLFVVDNSEVCDKTIDALKANIHYYYEDLDNAGIHHSGVLLSANARKWAGLPMHDDGTPMVMTYDEQSIATDFGHRVDLAGREDDKCGGCTNSPLWSTHLFYNRIPSLTEITQRFMQKTVPMDSLIVTNQKDQYRKYEKDDAQWKDATPNDYLANFTKIHSDLQKAYRVSAIAPNCPDLTQQRSDVDQSQPSAHPNDVDNAYRVLTEGTHGTYYVSDDCHFDMAEVLHDYASRVIFRAYVHAKTQIKLSKTPIDPTTIKVTIGGVDIPGGTGTATDEWTYDSGTNSVLIQWFKIDQGQLKPGDQVQVSYRVS